MPASSPQRQGQASSHHRESSLEGDLDGMVNDMFESTRHRREARRTDLTNHHHARKVEAAESINKTFDDHETDALQLRKAQTARLVGLLKRNDEIERCMATSVKTLERAYLSRSAELRAALESRIAELQ
ncbi:major facilitator superfamily [Diplodia corticola]|uniref:Major facilitator superfamily n=1 Tax=Diplodia corticola TaxID=236234 RepID=A0A1J9QTR3_9PEZI|nr:major facilitator superfamily [Diplodia corticola]OJD32366.1 major facilitator superfamily [Diplodia corticola]